MPISQTKEKKKNLNSMNFKKNKTKCHKLEVNMERRTTTMNLKKYSKRKRKCLEKSTSHQKST